MKDKIEVGKRILYRGYYYTIQEGVIQEISPNGKYVKIGGVWYKVGNISILDILESKTKLVSPNE